MKSPLKVKRIKPKKKTIISNAIIQLATPEKLTLIIPLALSIRNEKEEELYVGLSFESLGKSCSLVLVGKLC